MKTDSLLRRRAGVAFVAVALLAGCSASPSSPLAPPAGALVSKVRPLTESLLYSFTNSPDGELPEANLIAVGGTLYGTTFAGGTGSCNMAPLGACGTVFAMTPGGSETVLHSFTGPPDGNLTISDLVDVKGKLYGTTEFGGKASSTECGPGRDCGTVFSITPQGTESVLYSFHGAGSEDGSLPAAGLVEVSGTLYGTTSSGGANDSGTVFSVSTGGTEKVLYSFKGGSSDGAVPQSDLVDVGGTLYGTTTQGGTSTSECPNGCGVVFAVTTKGAETVLHKFAGAPKDGALPQLAGMIAVSNTLYGTTENGGANSAGTVFSITTKGSEKLLHSFGASKDGSLPLASLVPLGGTLYGTTSSGGAKDYGTVFNLVPKSGAESVVYSFSGGPSDGNSPRAGLVDVSGKLYGTTFYGGKTYNDGSAFILKP